MKRLGIVASIALAGSALVVVPTLNAQAGPPAQAATPTLIQQLRDQAQGSVKVSTAAATGKVSFLRAGTNGDLLPGNNGAPKAKAEAFLKTYAPTFGAPYDQLVLDDVEANDYGTSVSYLQEFQGLPVYGASVRAHVDKQGDLTAVNGSLVPVKSVDTTPHVTQAMAAHKALAAVRNSPPTTGDVASDVSGIKAKDAHLVVYRAGLVRGVAGLTETAWQVEVSNNRNVRDVLFISGKTGKVVNRFSLVENALERELLTEASLDGDDNVVLTKVWEEGDDLPGTLNEDQESMVRSTGEAYWFFRNVFHRDSYDGFGATMKTVNNDPRIACPNANWNSVTTNYCDGVSSDDVVAHEWGHAYTEYTHGLIYQWQPGALNESYSDIWGETIDLINGREDEGEGDLNVKRPVGLCSKYTRASIIVTIDAPAAVAGPCTDAQPASFGPVITVDPVTAQVTVAIDAADGDGPTTTDGCSAFQNGSAVAGHFAYVDRGTCPFAQKAANADAAGATGIIVGDSVAGRLPISMSGTADIYGAMVRKEDGDKIKGAGEDVTMTLKAVPADVADSYRWLIGEKSPAFGGAIRDMWNPNCYGMAGKVTDAEYVCDTSDAGGVHSNSGVSNHAYALLVDGGTFNSVPVKGIGLTKSAAIYYQAMSQYQNPATDFAQHADALEASCADLVGKPIRELSTADNDSRLALTQISATDCQSVAAANAAVEFRTDVTEQCGFEPLLDQNTPAICGTGFQEHQLFNEDFESGVGDWTQDSENPFGGPTKPWVSDPEAPQGHEGLAAYGAAPDFGVCDGSTDDFSSVNYLTSPEIQVGEEGEDLEPVLKFQHNVAMETNVDGGQVLVSINGGDPELVPFDAYLFNGPGLLIPEGGGNTNPMVEGSGNVPVDAFTGSDGGEVTSLWGESQIDLSAIGVAAGDTIQVTFAVGRDGCGGVDGWYVDDVQVVTCVQATATPTPTPTTTTPTATPTPTPTPTPTTTPTATPKAETTTEAKGPNYDPKYKADFDVKVKVKADGLTPTGKVEVTYQGDVIGKGTLKNGKVEITIKKNLQVGDSKLVVKYLGSDTTVPSKDKITVTVKKAKKH